MRSRDRAGALDVIPYQECQSPPMTSALRAACERSVHVLAPSGRRLRGGKAVLFVLHRLGHRRTAGLLAQQPLLGLVEAGYWAVARNRGWIGAAVAHLAPHDGSCA